VVEIVIIFQIRKNEKLHGGAYQNVATLWLYILNINDLFLVDCISQ